MVEKFLRRLSDYAIRARALEGKAKMPPKLKEYEMKEEEVVGFLVEKAQNLVNVCPDKSDCAVAKQALQNAINIARNMFSTHMKDEEKLEEEESES